MSNKLEKKGIEKLKEYFFELKNNVMPNKIKTFDLLVDGKNVEVKTKGKSFSKFDFISLTKKQYDFAQKEDYDIYIVSNLKSDVPEVKKIKATKLIKEIKPRVIISYEFDRKKLQSIVENL